MKYEQELKDFFRSVIFEEWMSEDDYNRIMTEALSEKGTTFEELCCDLEKGVNNGFSIDTQFKIIKNVLKK